MFLWKGSVMKKGLRKVLVLAMAGVMTIAPVMTASATASAIANQQQEWYNLSVRSRLHELFDMKWAENSLFCRVIDKFIIYQVKISIKG